jgi:hypothetical protein
VLLDAQGWRTRMTPNTWHKIKITVQLTTSLQTATTVTKLYVDDQLAGNATSSTNPSPFKSDAWTLTLGDFVGDYDEVRISNTLR